MKDEYQWGVGCGERGRVLQNGTTKGREPHRWPWFKWETKALAANKRE